MDDLPPPAGTKRTAWQIAAPWLILAAWLAIDLAAVVYLLRTEWGFLGALVLIIPLAFHLLALLVWVTTFAILTDCHWGERLGYFLLGVAAVVSITHVIEGAGNAGETQLLLLLAALVVGWSIPPLWLWRRDWRIGLLAAGDTAHLRQSLWQFSLSDVFIATTQAGGFFALLLATDVRFRWQDLPGLVLLFVGSPILLVALAWRRFWPAAVGCLSISAVLTVMHMACETGSFELQNMVAPILIIGQAVASLLIASGCLRSAGYRLR